MRSVFALCAVSGILLCSCKPENALKSPEFSEAERAVADQFSDPNSAQFRREQLFSSPNGVCGEVNVKNKFGGYIGFRPFFYDLGNKKPAVVVDAETSGEALEALFAPVLIEKMPLNCIPAEYRGLFSNVGTRGAQPESVASSTESEPDADAQPDQPTDNTVFPLPGEDLANELNNADQAAPNEPSHD